MRFGSIRAMMTVALAAAAMASLSGQAAAQEGGAADRVLNGQRFGAWTVSCEAIAVGETACLLSQRLVQSADEAFLAEIIAFWSADGSQSYIAARVPNGVYFPAGFGMRPAEGEAAEAVEFVWQSCSPRLCEAVLELDDTTLEGWEGAETLLAGYRPSVLAEPRVFRLTMSGLQQGLAALRPRDGQ